MAPRWVKKRDGRIEPFDEARVARAVIRGGRRAGSSEEVERLAREVARTVTLFLARGTERAPETSRIAQAVNDALEETGHRPLARAIRDWREWRQRRLAEVRVREPALDPRPASPGTPGAVEVVSRRSARPWSKQRVVQTLQAEAGLERDPAEDVARVVEERVFAAGLNQISSNLLRELIDAELFERGYSAQLGRLEVLGVPKPDLERLAFLGQGRAALALEDRVSRTALERFALDEIVDGPGAVAHRRGDVHLVGLGRPFRMASAAVCARSAAFDPREGGEPSSASEVARRLLRVVRRGLCQHELMFGLVGPERAFSPFVSDEPALRGAIELLIEALVAPCPDDVPPAPEVVFAVEAPPSEPGEVRALELLLEALLARGSRGAGVRMVLHLSEPGIGVERWVRAWIRGAQAGAACDLVVGSGAPPASRGTQAGVGTVQVALLNLAGLALAAGRGQRDRFVKRLEETAEATLEAFHRRHRRVFASVVRPAFPLFGQHSEGPQATGAEGLGPERLNDAVGLVGLADAMRYLTGMSPFEHPRVAELARELVFELRVALDAAAARLGLGAVSVEDVPSGDAAIRFAAGDLDRFADARELLGESAGWDSGVPVPAPGADESDLLAELKFRGWLAQSLRTPLVLPRPFLVSAPEDVVVQGVARTLERRTSSPGRSVEEQAVARASRGPLGSVRQGEGEA